MRQSLDIGEERAKGKDAESEIGKKLMKEAIIFYAVEKSKKSVKLSLVPYKSIKIRHFHNF